MQLTPHFSLEELLVTSYQDLAPQQAAGGKLPHVRLALESLCGNILEPIRAHIDRPIRINSGYRCGELNKRLPGSAPHSQHLTGQAADFFVPGWSDKQLQDLWKWIGWESKIKFGQCIFEDRHPETPLKGAWIHISLGDPWRAAASSGQILSWTPTGYVSHGRSDG